MSEIEEEVIEKGMFRLSACLDTVSTNVKGRDGRDKLRSLASVIREDETISALREINEQLHSLFEHADLLSESNCIMASFKELTGTFLLVGDAEIKEQMDTLEDTLLDHTGRN